MPIRRSYIVSEELGDKLLYLVDSVRLFPSLKEELISLGVRESPPDDFESNELTGYNTIELVTDEFISRLNSNGWTDVSDYDYVEIRTDKYKMSKTDLYKIDELDIEDYHHKYINYLIKSSSDRLDDSLISFRDSFNDKYGDKANGILSITRYVPTDLYLGKFNIEVSVEITDLSDKEIQDLEENIDNLLIYSI